MIHSAEKLYDSNEPWSDSSHDYVLNENESSITRQEIRELSDDELANLAASCDEEPADYDGCPACYAYLEQGHREEKNSPRSALDELKEAQIITIAFASLAKNLVLELVRHCPDALHTKQLLELDQFLDGYEVGDQ